MMGRLDLNIDDKLEERFRRAIFEKKGMKKGNLTKALEEAIEKWVKEQEELKKKSE
jgi:hypothetical protein